LLQLLSDVGYLDDLCIDYKGCKVTKFNIYPEECKKEMDKNKTIYMELNNSEKVSNAQLEFILPQAAKIYDNSTSGFFSGATLRRDRDVVTLVQPNATNTNSAEIKLWITNIPHGHHTIEIMRMTINGIDQHPSLFNCRWSLNSNAQGVTAERTEIDQ